MSVQTEPTAAPQRVSAARERLLRTASALFYAEGIRAVGVDRVIEEAGVTRATFYRHYPSKDDLVVAYLGVVHDTARAVAGDAVGERRLRLLIGSMAEALCAPGFRGCSFINAAAEFADPASPVHRAVAAHREWLTGVFVTDLRTLGHPDPVAAAAHLAVLRDGAMVAGYLADPELARTTLARGLDAILDEAR
jgi:AcrR family transcriptional regulator